jgi:hypothetical protein
MKVTYQLLGFGEPREFDGHYWHGAIAMLNMEARRYSSQAIVRVVALLSSSAN